MSVAKSISSAGHDVPPSATVVDRTLPRERSAIERVRRQRLRSARLRRPVSASEDQVTLVIEGGPTASGVQDHRWIHHGTGRDTRRGSRIPDPMAAVEQVVADQHDLALVGTGLADQSCVLDLCDLRRLGEPCVRTRPHLGAHGSTNHAERERERDTAFIQCLLDRVGKASS
jgi:hypothetical protein